MFVDSATITRALPRLKAGTSTQRAAIIGLGVLMKYRAGHHPIIDGVTKGTGAEEAVDSFGTVRFALGTNRDRAFRVRCCDSSARTAADIRRSVHAVRRTVATAVNRTPVRNRRARSRYVEWFGFWRAHIAAGGIRGQCADVHLRRRLWIDRRIFRKSDRQRADAGHRTAASVTEVFPRHRGGGLVWSRN